MSTIPSPKLGRPIIGAKTPAERQRASRARRKFESFETNKAPRGKPRGINCALAIRWLSASLRPKGRGIEPEEIQRHAYLNAAQALRGASYKGDMSRKQIIDALLCDAYAFVSTNRLRVTTCNLLF